MQTSTHSFVCLFIFCLFCLLVVPGQICSVIIEVPESYLTIQQAIEASTEGDTVLVGPDIYTENINFAGKNIMVTSHYLFTGDPAYIGSTIINGCNPMTPDSGSVVIFCGGENRGAVLQGFTIMGGGGTAWVDPQFSQYNWFSGGGIFIYMSSPTIRHNHIRLNTVVNNGSYDGASGGGLLAFRSNPLICNNIISQNQADYGAGLVVDYTGALIRNNIIHSNSGGQQYGGGGLYAIGNDVEPVLLENNTIFGNNSLTSGGGIQLWTSTVQARNNIIWNNTQTAGGQISGNSLDITYSNIQGGHAGTGNINLEPDFCDPDSYILGEESPCVDTGDPDPVYNDPENPAHPGDALFPARGSVLNDMGAHGGPYTACWEYTPANDDELKPQALALRELKNFPNPFYASPARRSRGTSISFLLEEPVTVGLAIFDIRGSNVYSSHELRLPVGVQNFTWNGSDRNNKPLPAGVYLYRLEIKERGSISGKCLLLD